MVFNKVAGVDSLGMLMGAISMGSLGEILNIFDQNIPDQLDKYYAMDSEHLVPGLGSDGKPLFKVSTTQSNILNGLFRFTRGDLERSTVLVPDVAEVQAGDLIVRYEAGGEPHIGVVVDYLDDNRPAYGQDPTAFMNNIIVASIRRGFRMVTLGTWGNPDNLFGGFTTDPKAYQIRRLLEKNADGNLSASYVKPHWELVQQIPKSRYEAYPGLDKVPREWEDSIVVRKQYSTVFNNDQNTQQVGNDYFNSANQIVFRNKERYTQYQLEKLRNGEINVERETLQNSEGTTTRQYTKTTDRYYLRFLPPTKYPDFLATALPLRSDENNKLPITQLTGFRCLTERERIPISSPFYYHIRYHKALDISTGGDPGVPLFRAPEDGIFYIINNSGDTQVDLPFDSDNIDSLTYHYSASGYGNIGVLITNPEKPREGRVYLFCHMEDMINDPNADNFNGGADNNAGRYNFYNGHFRLYSNSDNMITGFPIGIANAIIVRAGREIGHVGNKGAGSGPHIHLEVHEFFEEVGGESKDINSVLDKDKKGWQRVDPLSCFLKDQWIDYRTEYLDFENEEVYFNPDYLIIINAESPNQSKKVFRDWYLWDYKPDNLDVWRGQQ